MFVMVWRSAAQATRSQPFTSIHWSSQKRPQPVCEHAAWHPPTSSDSQAASPDCWHWTWQSRFAWASQLPSHAAWHSTAEQSDGAPVQVAPHWEPQVCSQAYSHT